VYNNYRNVVVLGFEIGCSGDRLNNIRDDPPIYQVLALGKWDGRVNRM